MMCRTSQATQNFGLIESNHSVETFLCDLLELNCADTNAALMFQEKRNQRFLLVTFV